MNKNIFRKSSIDRVNSPEQLNEYIRVANPGVWLILAAIVALLIGVVIWGVFGTIETTIKTGVIVEEDKVYCYVSMEDVTRLTDGMMVSVGENKGIIKNIDRVPIQVVDSFNDYSLYLSGLVVGDFCYVVEVEISPMTEGVYEALITVDSVHPISFVIH